MTGDQILAFMQKLSELLQPDMQRVWDILLRQVSNVMWGDMVGAWGSVAFALFGLGLLIWGVRESRGSYDSGEWQIGFGILILSISAVVAFLLFLDAAMMARNPEYYAILELAEMISGK